MRLLVLGGTVFVGRHLVSKALARGHDVTLFNRGRTNPHLFSGVDQRRGDRASGELDALRSGRWDAAVDVSGRRPELVRATAELLRPRADVYCLVSSVAVYAHVAPVWTDEEAELLPYDPAREPLPTAYAYGARKVGCERAVRSAYGDRSLIVRPGVIVGPHDPTGRFAHWVARAALGGTVLGPARPQQPVQVVHAEDLAEFVLDLLEGQEGGTFNCVGPDRHATFADLLDACQIAAGVPGEVAWAPDDLLSRCGIALPLALPATGWRDGAYLRSGARAAGRGLRNRPLAETARSTQEWLESGAAGGSPPFVVPEGERQVLASLAGRRQEIGGTR